MAYELFDCASWDELLEEVMRVTHEFEGKYSGSPVPFFRGHSSPSYQLLPGLFRHAATGRYNLYDEKNFYYEFRARAGALLNPSFTSWDVLFLMQHHGSPRGATRLDRKFRHSALFRSRGSDIRRRFMDVGSLPP